MQNNLSKYLQLFYVLDYFTSSKPVGCNVALYKKLELQETTLALKSKLLK